MKYWPYVVREDEPCLPSWFSYRLTAVRSGEDWWKSRWNGQTAEDEDGRSIKEQEANPRRTWEPSINSTYGAPLLFQAKTRGDVRLCHAHHTLLENVQIPFLTPPLSWSFSLFFVFFYLAFFSTTFPHPTEISSFASEWKMKRNLQIRMCTHLIFMLKYIIRNSSLRRCACKCKSDREFNYMFDR